MKRATALIAALSVALVAALALALNTLKPVELDLTAQPVAAAEAKAPAPAHDVQDVAAVESFPAAVLGNAHHGLGAAGLGRPESNPISQWSGGPQLQRS